jgi:hypothetical protein
MRTDTSYALPGANGKGSVAALFGNFRVIIELSAIPSHQPR